MGSTVTMKFNIRKNVSGYLLFLLMHINEKSRTEVVETTNTVPECNATTSQGRDSARWHSFDGSINMKVDLERYVHSICAAILLPYDAG